MVMCSISDSRGGYWYRKSYCDILRYVIPHHDLYHDILGLLVCFVLWVFFQLICGTPYRL